MPLLAITLTLQNGFAIFHALRNRRFSENPRLRETIKLIIKFFLPFLFLKMWRDAGMYPCDNEPYAFPTPKPTPTTDYTSAT